MTVTYTTAAKVQAYLQRTTAFGVGTNPTATTVESYIYRAESRIDEATTTSWRSQSISNETHTMRVGVSGSISIGSPYIQLKHKPVVTFASGTDTLEVWNGSAWADWVSTKTEGRNNDYWVDYDKGVVYFVSDYPLNFFTNGVRVSYRYGASGVPEWVEDVATKIAAVEILRNEWTRMDTQPDSMDITDINNIIDRLEREIELILDPTKPRMRKYQVQPVIL